MLNIRDQQNKKTDVHKMIFTQNCQYREMRYLFRWLSKDEMNYAAMKQI